MKICVYAIAKNEERHVEQYAKWAKEADGVYVLDTGSTDRTVEKLKAAGIHVEEHRYEEGAFRFDDARNRSLALVPEDADICVCTDMEEWFSEGWRKELETQWAEAVAKDDKVNAAEYDFWVKEENGRPTYRFNGFKIHKRNVGKWKYACHEVIEYGAETPYHPFFVKNIVLHNAQRTAEENATRHVNYLPLLKIDVTERPEDCRAAHYYGRELMNTGHLDEAIREFTRHLSIEGGWSTERAQSMRYMARCYRNKGMEKDAEYWYGKAVSEEPLQRESALELAEYALERKEYDVGGLAALSAVACKTKRPIYVTEEGAWGAYPYVLLAKARALSKGIRDKTALCAASIACHIEPTNKDCVDTVIKLGAQAPVYPINKTTFGILKKFREEESDISMPDWEGLFDKIHLIHYVGHQEREAHITNELKRIGVWGCKNFTTVETVRTKWEEKLADQGNAGIVNLALNTLKILMSAKAHGYKRILIFEDDICALKNIGLLSKIVNSTPLDSDIVVYDKLVLMNPMYYAKLCAQYGVNEYFAMWESGIFGGSFYAVGERAYDTLIDVYEKKLQAPDVATQVKGLKKTFSIVNASAQFYYDGCCNMQKYGSVSIKNGYAFQGLDFRLYNMPKGYGYDAPVKYDDVFSECENAK